MPEHGDGRRGAPDAEDSAAESWVSTLPIGEVTRLLDDLARADEAMMAALPAAYGLGEPADRLALLLLDQWSRSLDLSCAELACLIDDPANELRRGLAALVRRTISAELGEKRSRVVRTSPEG